ncbi:MAG: flagellar basal body L-ring protein FlgH [Planctomycetaceae bacterium]|nr:flagellar basal body L-ring protein FlgH [Planctomycetaceae bacterium]
MKNQHSHRRLTHWVSVASVAALGLCELARPAMAQPPLPPPPPNLSPMVPTGPFVASPRPIYVRDHSFIFIEPPPAPSLIKVHDILTIEVDEKAEVIINSRFNRQRNGSYKLELKDFVRVIPGPKLVSSESDTPTIEGTLSNRLQTIGQGSDSEGITYKIAATVVDVLPNGTIVLEARKSIRTNQDVFEYRLTGRVDKGKIKPDRTARTEDIAELQIERIQRGKIFDSTKVNWGTRILDTLMPF